MANNVNQTNIKQYLCCTEFFILKELVIKNSHWIDVAYFFICILLFLRNKYKNRIGEKENFVYNWNTSMYKRILINNS